MQDPGDARCLTWLAALHIHPRKPDEWSAQRGHMTTSYLGCVSEEGLERWTDVVLPHCTAAEDLSVANPVMMNVIHADVVRLGRSFPLFDVDHESCDHSPDSICRYQILCRRFERILYVMGSVYRTMRYIQGFNELLVPLYYVLIKAPSLFESDDEIEATAFHCLHSLISMTSLAELYATQDSSSNLLRRLFQFEELVQKHFPNAYSIIKIHRVHPACYCFKWFSLMFTQDHELLEVIELWDVLLTHVDCLVDYLFLVGLGHVKQMQNRLDAKDSSTTIHALQDAWKCNLKVAIRDAEQIWRQCCRPPGRSGWKLMVIVCALILLTFVIFIHKISM
jgi:hypothetical protein